jgi:NADH-ubiquinone oxidoreductase chain 4
MKILKALMSTLLIYSLLFIPVLGIVIISSFNYFENEEENIQLSKYIALTASIINLIVSFVMYILFNSSTNQFQFVEENFNIQLFNIYMGVDSISIYFVLLTTIIMPIAILANWNSIKENMKSYLIIMLLLETLLIAVFLVLDILLFYIFFESVLPPLFILIGLFGSKNKVRASYYFFLYTLWGSLFLLLSILSMYSIMGTTDFEGLFKLDFNYKTQLILFAGIFIAFAVKTPTIFLNNW